MNFSIIVDNLIEINSNLFADRFTFMIKKEKIFMRKIKVAGTSFELRHYNLGDYTLIEQNPFENSKDSRLAKGGEEISLLIENSNDKILYKIKKNKLIKLW